MRTRLSEPQITCLWAIALGSYGEGSHVGTLASLRRRGLIRGREWQGRWVWDATDQGAAALEAEGVWES